MAAVFVNDTVNFKVNQNSYCLQIGMVTILLSVAFCYFNIMLYVLGGNNLKFGKLIILLSAFFIITACSNTNDEKNAEIKIYTTVYPLQFLVEEIAGDTIDVDTVYPPGVDEHTYEPTSKELTAISDGDAFFYIGAGLEAFASTAADALANQNVKMIEIGQHEDLFLHNDDHEHSEDDGHDHHGHNHGDIDPHIWLDPLRMIDIAYIIKDELINMHPEDKTLYEENLKNLEAELIDLDDAFQQLIDTKANKKMLVTHAAFGYWQDRYHIEQIAIHGLSTETEPSQKELISIIDTANEHELKHIIFEQNVTTRVSEVIREEIDAEPLKIHNLSVRTDEDIKEGRDYLSIMRDNLEVLDEAMH